ncbi:MAG: DUF5677 domain-containing protein [Terrimicrobiaceae bacterium]
MRPIDAQGRPKTLPSEDITKLLKEHIPYRLAHLLDAVPRIPATCIADNQAFEAGAVAGRSLLSFLGIRCDRKQGILKPDRCYIAVGGMTDDVKAPDVGGSFVDLDALAEDEKSLLGRFIHGVHKSSAHFTWKSGQGLDVQTYRDAACLIQRLLRDHIPQMGVPCTTAAPLHHSALAPSEIKAALDYVEELRLLANAVKLPSGLPGHVAGACFAIVQEHHHAIVRLLEMGLNSPAFVLLRPMFETYVRGEWLARRTKQRVKKFLEREESLELDKLIASLESTDDFKTKFLSQVKDEYWSAMCDYAHTGGRHIGRWLTHEGIQSNYSRGEILEVTQAAETIVCLSMVTGLARLANDGDLQRRTLEAFERRMAQYAS